MSYLERTKSEFWNFNDALKYFLEKNENKLDISLSKFAEELARFDNKTAKRWRSEWKVRI